MVDTIVRKLYGVDELVPTSYEAFIERYPGRLFALSMTASTPPALLIPNVTTTTSAIVITILCIRSVVETALKPPIIVYPTITAAEINIATI